MAAFDTATLESCRSRGMDPAGPCRPVSLVEIRPEWADCVEKLAIALGLSLSL